MLRPLCYAALLFSPLVACSETSPEKIAPATQSSTVPATPTDTAAKKEAPAAQTPAEVAPAADAIDAAAATPTDDPAVKAIREFIASKNIDKTKPKWKTSLPKPPQVTFDPAKKYYWALSTTEGPIKILLHHELAPMHVSNAIYLTELGFYDELSFHRVIQGFMAQGGDPLGNGMGNPGYKLNLEVTPKLKHDKAGVLSTANSGPNTDGSQFFLMFKDAAFLDGKYSIYGETVEGLETLKNMEKLGKAQDPAPPSKPILIQTAKIVVE